MEEPRSDWQQQYAKAQPPRALLWCAAHRRLVRAIGGLILALTVANLVWAALDGGRLVSPVLGVVTWSFLFALWGFRFPHQVDERVAERGAGPAD